MYCRKLLGLGLTAHANVNTNEQLRVFGLINHYGIHDESKFDAVRVVSMTIPDGRESDKVENGLYID